MAVCIQIAVLMVAFTLTAAARVKRKSEPSTIKAAADSCGEAVEGSQYRDSAWRRIEKCKCADGFSLLGSDPACGDGTKKYFSFRAVTGKQCRCSQNKECPTVSTQKDFDLDSYINGHWFIQQQMQVAAVPENRNYCINALYEKLPKPSVWGYTVQVRNKASGKDGSVTDSGSFLCAYAADASDPAKLAVAPCFLPKAAAGPYWVLAYNEEDGYALISGGQPTISTPLGCRTQSGVNNAGLWIFTRKAKPRDGLIQEVREIAKAKGFDLSVLNVIDHSNCTAAQGPY